MKIRYIVDTNHLGQAVNPVSKFRDRVAQERRSGAVFGTCSEVLCELQAGLRKRPDYHDCMRQMRRFCKNIRLWPMLEEDTVEYGLIYHELKRKGRKLSMTDMILAAFARRHKLTILSTDRDFEALPDIAVENWVDGV